jgi:hypothetical protein
VKLTANAVRIRLPDLDMPWREAIDIVLDAIEATRPLTATEKPQLSAVGSG